MNMNIDEVLRYMGYRGEKADKSMIDIIEDCACELEAISRCKATYSIFDIHREKEEIYLKDSILLLKGKDIYEHLLNSEKCAVMAVTLGIEVDKHINMYAKTNLIRSFVFDACATSAVEIFCDKIQEEVKEKAKELGFQITGRFSPGYGDFSIEIQKDIAKTLRLYEKIGLSVNENSIMIPRKSVTAFIGFQNSNCDEKYHKCRNCNKINCMYRRGEDNNE